jgi:hypothetical protein
VPAKPQDSARPAPAASPSSDLPARDDRLDRDDQIPRQRWFALIPRGSLWKALAMVLMLVVIVFLQRRAEVVVRQLGQLAPAPVSAPNGSAAAPGARLRLASPPSPGHASSPPPPAITVPSKSAPRRSTKPVTPPANEDQ